MSFKEYYQYYLSLHQSKWTRRLHILGQLATISFVVFCVLNSLWLMLLLTPFVVYPFAWSGHAFFEKNKPAAFSRPLWAKACDWVMIKDILTGKIRW
jgi:hypothetical protein